MKKIILMCLISPLFLSDAFASREGVLELSAFSIESKGIGSSGPISISGKKNEKEEFVSLKVTAFGKEYEISNEDLKIIPKL